tara:strand:- start:6238 stop:8523 length:2286 start_codon:yes stop_codon:yes gene_type:complete
MALYDDASFIFLASGAAGVENKDFSKALCVKPVEVTGPELLSSSDGDWTLGTGGSISNGVITVDGSQSSSINLFQNITDLDNKSAKISFTISNHSAGTIQGQFFGGNEVTPSVGQNGTFAFTKDIGGSHNGNAGFGVSSDFEGTISNISIKEVTTKAADFDISRDANLDATRVGPTGLIEKGRENKFLYSNNFSKNIGTWGHNGLSSVIGIHNSLGQEGYDGTNNASYIRASDATGVHKVLLSAQAGVSVNSQAVQTISIHAKPLGYTFLAITTQSGNQEAYFDLANGTVGTTESDVIEAKITPAGNGYFRCSMTVNADIAITQINFNIALEDNNHSFTGDPNRGGTDNGGIFIQDAQWELGLVPTEIISSNGSAGTAGIKEDEPRFDYPLAGGAPSLLLEPQRQNELSYSEYFEGWASTSNATLTSNDVISPEGVKNATKLLATAGDTNHQVNSESLTVASGAVSASIFAKKGNTNVVRLRLNGTTSQVRAWFDLQNGTTSVDGNGTSTITEMNNGWFLCTVTEAGNTNTGVSLQVFINENLDETTFAADGDEFIYIYGAQLEEGKFCTSYIPTHGTAATRSADTIADLTSIPSVNTSTYTFFAHVSQANTGGTGNRGPRMKNASNDALMGYFINNSDQKQFFLDPDSAGGGSNRTFSTTDISPVSSTQLAGDEVKYAFVINGTSVKCFVDGNTLFNGTASGVVTANRIVFNTSDGTPDHIKSVIYFPSAISNIDALVLTDTNYGSYSEMVNSLSYTQHG